MRVKWIFLSAGAFILVALVAVVVILMRFNYNSLKPRAEQAVYDATGRELKLAGDIRLKLGFAPVLAVENVSFENADWGSREEMATMKRLEVQVALIPLLKRDIQIKKFILIGPDILIETNEQGKSNLSFEKPAQAAEQPSEPAPGGGKPTVPFLAFDQVRIENGRLTYKDGKTNKTHTASILELTAAAPDRNGPIELEAEGAFNENPFKLKGSVGSIAAATDAAQPWPLKLEAETLGTTVRLDGSIKDVMKAKGIDINMAAEGQSIREIVTFAGVREAPDPGPFSVSARLTDPAADTYKLSDLKMNLRDSDLAGTVEIALAGKRPRLNANLTSQKIDLRPILAEEESVPAASETPEGAPRPKPKKERVFPENKLPLDIVKKLDGNINMRAAKIFLPKLALDAVSADIALDDGILAMRPIKASTGGGSFDGQAQLSVKGEAADVELAFKIAQLNLGQMLAELGLSDRLEGDLDADVQLSGQGSSVADLMAKLKGTTIMVIEGGRISNKYLALLEADLGSGLLTLLNPEAQDQNYTDLNCLVSRFDVKDGLADSTVLLVDTASMTVAGDGTINLQNEKLNLSLIPSPKKGVAAQAGSKVGVNLGELAAPFKLGGTLANPKLAIDPKQSVAIAGRIAELFGSSRGKATAEDVPAEDPCAAAKKIAETGEVPEATKAQQQKSLVEELAPGLSEGTEGALGEAEQQLRKFFGR